MSQILSNFQPSQEVQQSPEYKTTLHSLEEVHGPSWNFPGLEMTNITVIKNNECKTKGHRNWRVKWK